MRKLSELAVGERGRVVRIEGQGALAERLAAMGVTVGATVQVVRRAPLGDPVDFRVRGYHLSLRRREAELVYVEPEDAGAPAGGP